MARQKEEAKKKREFQEKIQNMGSTPAVGAVPISRGVLEPREQLP
jgi:hypothetical protein